MFRRGKSEPAKGGAGGNESNSSAIKIFEFKSRLLRNIIIGSIVFIVVGGALWGGWLYYSDHKAKNDINDKYSRVVETATKQYLNGQTQEAKSSLEDLLNKSSKYLSQEQKNKINDQLITINANSGNGAEAVKAAESALNNTQKPNFVNYYNTAVTCETAKNNICAIKYYKLASDALDKNNGRPPAWQNYKRVITEKIKNLEGAKG